MGRGYCYEITTDKDNILFMGESDLYEYAQHEFDYASDLGKTESMETARDFAARISSDVEELEGENGRFLAVRITNEDKLRYFGNRLERARELINSITPEEFATSDCYELRSLIQDDYGDMVYLNSSLYTLDAFVREADPDKTYYIGNACLIH